MGSKRMKGRCLDLWQANPTGANPVAVRPIGRVRRQSSHGTSTLLPPRGGVVLAHPVLPAGRPEGHASSRADDGAPDEGPRTTERAAAAVTGAAFGRCEVRSR